MDYVVKDIETIAKILSGTENTELPECIKINESILYEYCYDMNCETTILDENIYEIAAFASFMCYLAENDRFVEFIDYYFNRHIENRITDLVANGYSVFKLKDELLNKLNASWSIPNQEIGIQKSKFCLITVDFKEYDKMGQGGFCAVYRCPSDGSKVFKVLNKSEKGDISAVHRFKREFEIMHEHNDSGYTLNVFDYDSQALVYSMEKADISLEDYIVRNQLPVSEKENIIIRCAECMKYLHNKGILHRDFHPGNILLKSSGDWAVTDFGLAKDIASKYSHQTTTTHAVGRAWFTDPAQLFALKDGNFKTDMFSLAKTIDFVMNENMSGKAHKYSSVVYKSTAPDPDVRYNSIDEMYKDLMLIHGRPIYESAEEVTNKIIQQYKESGKLEIVQLVSALNDDFDGNLMWNLVTNIGYKFSDVFIKISDVSFEVSLREARKVASVMRSSFHPWDDYDTVAIWAAEIVNTRKTNDELNVEMAKIVEYVAHDVGRYAIKRESNNIKNNTQIDGHIRAILTYYEGY